MGLAKLGRLAGALTSAVLVATFASGCGDAGSDSSDSLGQPVRELDLVPREELPASFVELPLGDATTMPWWQDGVLHLGTREIPSRWSRIAYRGGTTVVGTPREDHSEWYVVNGDSLLRLPTGDTVDEPYISGNGRWIAWLDEEATGVSEYVDDVSYRIVLYDVDARAVSGTFEDRRTVEWEDGIGAIWMRGVDLDGRVFFSIGDHEPQVWRPGSDPVPITGKEYLGQSMDQWPRGAIYFDTDRSNTEPYGVFGTVADSGGFEAVGRIRSPLNGWWSDTGHAYLYKDYSGSEESQWVDRVDDGRSIQLGVPAVDSVVTIGWESAEAVILWHHEPGVSVVLRCNAVDGSCERVPDGPRARAPATMPNRFQ